MVEWLMRRCRPPIGGYCFNKQQRGAKGDNEKAFRTIRKDPQKPQRVNNHWNWPGGVEQDRFSCHTRPIFDWFLGRPFLLKR